MSRQVRSIKSVEVFVRLIDFRGDFVRVSGAIDNPGIHPCGDSTRLMTVMEMIRERCARPACPRRATATPDWSQAFVLREDKLLDVDFEKLLGAKPNAATAREKALSNVLLEPGDRIYVPPVIKLGSKVYVVGAVGYPRLIRYHKEITYLEAMVRAGDVPCSAWERKSFIIRGKMKHPTIIPVNAPLVRTGKIADILLKPGDVIFVPRKSIKKTLEVVRQLDVIYGQVAQAEAACNKRLAFERK
jgi:protein involved in polysaccharide export with SLBB domain